MTVNQLKRLIRFLPESFLEEMKDRDFTTCWYASSGLDKRPMELLDYSHPDTLTDEKVDVFFYTDIDFFTSSNYLYMFFYEGKVLFPNLKKLNGTFTSLQSKEGEIIASNLELDTHQIYPELEVVEYYSSKRNFQNKVLEFQKICSEIFSADEINEDNDLFFERMDAAMQLECESEICADFGIGLKNRELISNFIDLKLRNFVSDNIDWDTYKFGISMVAHQRADNSVYFTFYIDIDDSTFEKVLIKNELKIDFGSNRGGMGAGPGPRLLGNLGCRYFLGDDPRLNLEQILPETPGYKPYNMTTLRQFNWRTENDVFKLWEVE